MSWVKQMEDRLIASGFRHDGIDTQLVFHGGRTDGPWGWRRQGEKADIVVVDLGHVPDGGEWQVLLEGRRDNRGTWIQTVGEATDLEALMSSLNKAMVMQDHEESFAGFGGVGALSPEQVAQLEADLNSGKPKRKDPYLERSELLAAGGWVCRNCGAPNAKKAKTCRACSVKKGDPMQVEPKFVPVDHQALERAWQERSARRRAGIPDELPAGGGDVYGPRTETEEERLERRKAERAADDARWLEQIGPKLDGFAEVSNSCDLGAHERCAHCDCGCHGELEPRMTAGPFKICPCGREFSEEQWGRLKDLGAQVTEEDGIRYTAFLKNCPSCHSTLAVETSQRM